MSEQPNRRFIFRGSATPFGGRINTIDGRPYQHPLTSPPSSALTVAGGYSVAKSRGDRFRNAFEWGETFAMSKGEVRPRGNTVTNVECSLACFRATNAPFTFSADLLHLAIVSDHPVQGEPSIVPIKVYFGGKDGLLLDNDPIEVVTNDYLYECPTFGSLQRRYQQDPKFFASQSRIEGRPADECNIGEPLKPGSGGYIYTSIVERLKWRGQDIPGHILHLTGFGKIYFGEVLINSYNRRFTMIRLAMGSYMSADAACVEADPNGTW